MRGSKAGRSKQQNHARASNITLGDYIRLAGKCVDPEPVAQLKTTLNPQCNSVVGKPSRVVDPKPGSSYALWSSGLEGIVAVRGHVGGRPPDPILTGMDDVMLENDESEVAEQAVGATTSGERLVVSPPQ